MRLKRQRTGIQKTDVCSQSVVCTLSDDCE